MLDINLQNYNEMLRYERDMDLLRALALWNTTHDHEYKLPGMPKPREYVFDIIKHFSKVFASDIRVNGSIPPDTLSRFHSALFSLNQILGIKEEDIVKAKEQQRYQNSGFWEMSRVFGQFHDMAEYAKKDEISHIITAAVSGCIIGEYLAQIIKEKYGDHLPVDHMIFSRSGPEPVEGMLPESFKLSGNKVLFVDDAVMGTITSQIMVKELIKINPDLQISLMTVAIDPDTKQSGYLDQFSHVYLFEE